MSVLEDGRQARQQVLDGRGHLRHADHVHDRFQGAEDAAQHLGVLVENIYSLCITYIHEFMGE